ncbi:MAG: hypothetical protein RLY86_2063 [Pseudomonadota bacterium]
MRDGRMSLRATITIDLTTESFVDAGDHQQRLTEILDQVRARYPAAVLAIKELRARGGVAPMVAPGAMDGPIRAGGAMPALTGNLRPYAGVAG